MSESIPADEDWRYTEEYVKPECPVCGKPFARRSPDGMVAVAELRAWLWSDDGPLDAVHAMRKADRSTASMVREIARLAEARFASASSEETKRYRPR